MIAVDVEASGIDPNVHSILSLGAVDISNPDRQLYVECHVWDGAKIDPEALAVNGFSREDATDTKKPSEADLVHEFIPWALQAPERTFAGQNPSFDRDFLQTAAKRAGHTDWPFAHRTVDTHSLCWMHMVTRGLTPPIDPVKKHSTP
jgi:DNA polymerase III epsilon subunit-like protein